MKIKAIYSVAVVLALLFLAGCPRRNPDPGGFTSADTSGSYRADALAGVSEEAGVSNDAGSGERELVEPDVIRREGSLLYVLNQYRGLTIVDLDTESVLSQTPTLGYPRDLYLVEGRAYVLVSYAQDVLYDDGMITVDSGSKLYVLNVENPAAVHSEGVFSFEGDLIDSRMVGDVLYAVCSEYTSYSGGIDDNETVVSDTAEKSYGATWVISLNIADPANIAVADSLSFTGEGNLIQATNEAIFSVSTDWNQKDDSVTSIISYVDISDSDGAIVLRGSARAPGYMADRFKMDAWNGALRVVTHTGWSDPETYITTFDISDPDTLAQLGQISLVSASGENLFATRFEGERAYIVTYFTVDPLFVVDLSDPANPQVKGELKIPGWSTHIEPRGDRLIALGVDDTSDERKVMVSLFDVSVPENPVRIAYESFGEGWTWSSAYSDVKAFTVMDDRLLIPFSGWNGGAGGYDRLQFVAWNRDALEMKGAVDLQGSAIRSFAYDGLYYAVTQEQLAVIDTTADMAPVIAASVTLAENIVDVVPLSSNGWVVEVIARGDEDDVLLRAVHPASGTFGTEVVLPMAHVVDTFTWNGAVGIVGSVYEYEPQYSASYQVSLFDFSVPEQPVFIREWQVPLEPWQNGWGCCYPMMEAASVRAEKDSKLYWNGYGNGDDSVFQVGDYLLLRGMSSTYDIQFGDETPWQGIALLDLAGVEPLYIAGLGYEEVSSIASVEGLVYMTTKTRVGSDTEDRSVCSYYLRTFNPVTREMADPVNVPGLFLQHVPNTDYVLFQDIQYFEDWQTTTVLQSTEMKGGVVTLLDSASLPTGYWEILVEEEKLWYCGQTYTYTGSEGGDSGMAVSGYSGQKQYDDDGSVLGFYPVDTAGMFLEKQQLFLGTVWCNLLGIKDNQVFIAVEAAAVARCNFAVTPPVIEEITTIMGYPDKISFEGSTAYIPLGYSGVGVLPY